MPNLFPYWLLFPLAGVLAAYSAQAARCEAPRLMLDTKTLATQARPVIEWIGSDQADFYQIELVSRVPEGRVLENFIVDVSGLRFQPPRLIAFDSAVVSVSVRANCKGVWSSPGKDSSHAYLLKLDGQCPAPGDLSVSRTARSLVLRWKAPSAVRSFEVAHYALPAMRLLKTLETSESQFVLPASDDDSIIAIRSRCAPGVSEPVFLAP
jgi:hypothetical protein